VLFVLQPGCDPNCDPAIGCATYGGGLCDGNCTSGYGPLLNHTCAGEATVCARRSILWCAYVVRRTVKL
jgi:hypothetical protein